MNLDNINTPSDLINQNEQESPEKVAYDAMFALDAPEALAITCQVLGQLASWHQERAAESKDPECAAAWAIDEGRLHVALMALTHVTF